MSRWYKRSGADFINGTMGLSLEAKGAYSLCLDLIYDRGGPIPDDARYLAGVCNVSVRRWNALRDQLVAAGKLYAANGSLSNARADQEIVSAEIRARERAESGAKGGRKSSENAGALNENAHLGQAELEHLRGEENRIDSVANATDAEASVEARKKALWDKARTLLTNDGLPKKAAGEMVGKWFHTYGLDLLTEAIDAAAAEAPAGVRAWVTAWLQHRIAPADGAHETTLVEWIAARQPRMRPDERLEWARAVLKPIADKPAEAIRKGVRDALAEAPKFVNEVPDLVSRKVREWARLDANPAPAARKPEASKPDDEPPPTADQIAAIYASVGYNPKTALRA